MRYFDLPINVCLYLSRSAQLCGDNTECILDAFTESDELGRATLASGEAFDVELSAIGGGEWGGCVSRIILFYSVGLVCSPGESTSQSRLTHHDQRGRLPQ